MLEKKYEEALAFIEASADEEFKMSDSDDADVILNRFRYTSSAYIEIYLLLDRDEDALKKYEEMVSTLSNEQVEKIHGEVFLYRIILFSRLNRLDDYIAECNKLLNRPIPSYMDCLSGYTFGALGYTVKQDYINAEKYLLSAEEIFQRKIGPLSTIYSGQWKGFAGHPRE
jgi:tetratricopeptide (TPR) repeat protein